VLYNIHRRGRCNEHHEVPQRLKMNKLHGLLYISQKTSI
jgi:hypothetical protein